VRANFDDALAVLRGAGAVIEEVQRPTIGYAIAVYYIVRTPRRARISRGFDGIAYGHRSAQRENDSRGFTSSRAARVSAMR